MELYVLALKGIETLFEEIGKSESVPVIEDCIENWEKKNDRDALKREFAPGGRLADFRIDSRTAETPAKGFWAAQVLSALIALAAQLADFRKKGISDDIEFIRRNFGAANEIMTLGKCTECGNMTATASDIDKYISRIVIAKRLVSGLESGDICQEVQGLVQLTCPDIQREKKKALLRLDNSGIEHSEKYGKLVSCTNCGSRKITEGRILRSLRENVFVALN